MVYTDLIFLFGLFPVSAIISLLDRSSEYKNMILIITSLLFFSWGRPFAVCLIFLTVVTDWILGLSVKAVKSKKSGKKFAALFPVIISGGINIFVMIWYVRTYIDTLSPAPDLTQLIMHSGSAYCCLRGFSYVYDVYKGKTPAEKNIFCLLTYIISFHLMCAGPLVRYSDMESQIRNRDVTTDKLNAGLNRMFWGLAKIVLLARVFASVENAGLNSSEITTLGCWLGMLAFFARYYFIFTGLCDMSRGLSLVGGFVLPINYRDIDPDGLFTGFVKSYNSTVISFFSDVIGISSNPSKLHFASGALLCSLLMGLWYQNKDMGSTNFLIAAAAAGIFVTIEQLFLKDLLSKLPTAVKYIYIAVMSMLIFGALHFDSIYGYRKWLFALAGINTQYTLSVAVKSAVLKNLTLIIISFFVVCPHARRAVIKLTDSFSATNRSCYSITRAVKTICTAFVFLLSVMTLILDNSV